MSQVRNFIMGILLILAGLSVLAGIWMPEHWIQFLLTGILLVCAAAVASDRTEETE